MMKLVIPTWQDRVSPVLDVAGSVLLVDLSAGLPGVREQHALHHTGPWPRGRELADLGADTVICAAVSRPLETVLSSLGLRVIAGVCGPLDPIVEAFVEGRLDDRAFRLPGCRGHRGHACSRRRQRGGRRWM